ncbi:MAG: hypothetical protein NVSMB2_13620 [Chloroflexota bacterium]
MTSEPSSSAQITEAYRVADVRSDSGESAPPEIVERFGGRMFSLKELEARGVRITGRTGWFIADARDWVMRLELAAVR